jgi:hypothetical protein
MVYQTVNTLIDQGHLKRQKPAEGGLPSTDLPKQDGGQQYHRRAF